MCESLVKLNVQYLNIFLIRRKILNSVYYSHAKFNHIAQENLIEKNMFKHPNLLVIAFQIITVKV